MKHVMLIAAATLAAGHMHVIRRRGSSITRDFGRGDSGTYRMPGQMMTKRGKKNQMQRDFQNCNRRKGKPR